MPFTPINKTTTSSFTPLGSVAEKPTLSESLWSKVASATKQFGIGVAKGVGSTALGMGTLGTKALATVLPESLTPKTPDIYNPETELGKEAIEKTTPEGTAQKVGFGVEKVAEVIAPATKINTATKGLSFFPKIALRTAGDVGTTALQTGGDTGEMKETGAISAGLQVVAPILGKISKIIGEGVYKSAIPTSAKEAQFLQSYKAGKSFAERTLDVIKGTSKEPTTVAKTAFEKGLFGTESMLGVQAKRATNSLWKDFISPQLKQSKVQVNMPSFFDEAREQIIKENPELGRQKDLLEALEAMKDDYKDVLDVPIEKLQDFKKGWAQFVPEKAYRGKPIAAAYGEVKDTVSGLARNAIYESLGPEAKQAYFDYGNLLGLQELGQKAMTGGKLKGGFGTFWSAVKDMALTPVATVGGNTIYKVGQGLEFFGKPGLRNLIEIFDLGGEPVNES